VFGSRRSPGKQVPGGCGCDERDPRHRLRDVKGDAARDGIRRRDTDRDGDGDG
jgi:hypothetical protein